jgi:hypothetical protein
VKTQNGQRNDLDGRFAVTTQFYSDASRFDVAVRIAHPKRRRIRPVRVREETRPMAANGCRAAAHGVSVLCGSLVSLVARGAVIGLILWYAIRLGW